jgi:predicted GIY-YIG superfamily endonuclease
VVSSVEGKKEEVDNIKKALKTCGYPEWTFKVKDKSKQKTIVEERNPQKHMIVLPYFEGLGEKLVRVYKKHNINTVFKPENTLRQLLVAPKDKIPKEEQCGCIYRITCKDCEQCYIGESGRTLKTRLKEHRKGIQDLTPSSAVAEHAQSKQHLIDWENVKIIDKESHLMARKIKEAIHIRKNKPKLNRDSGVDLPYVYNVVLDRGNAPKTNAPSIVS